MFERRCFDPVFLFRKEFRKTLDIPYNRQQLADYLNVERSALSNELSLMRQDGILQYDKNHFVVSETADVK